MVHGAALAVVPTRVLCHPPAGESGRSLLAFHSRPKYVLILEPALTQGDGNFSSDLRASLNVSTMLYLRTCHSGCTEIPPVLPSLSPVHSTIHSVTASASCTVLPSLISPHLLAD